MATNGSKLSSSFFIGLFVITGTFILLGTLIWLGANQFLKEQVFYVTYFKGSVEGLETGSAVKYQGVPCGAVKSLKVAPDGRLVEVILRIDPNIDINDSLRIQPALAGIAGGKFLQLHYPTNPELAEMYPNPGFKPPYKYIRSSPSGLEEITIAMQEVMNNLMAIKTGEISNEMISFLQSSTKFFSNDTLYTILHNLQNSSAHMTSILSKADTSRIFHNLAATSEKLLLTANEVKRFADSLNGQLTNLNLPQYVDKAFARYDSAMYNTQDVINAVGYRTESLIFGFSETMEELKKTNKQLKKSLRAITEDPAHVFLSEPPKPE